MSKLSVELKPERPDSSRRDDLRGQWTLGWFEFVALAVIAGVSLYISLDLPVPWN